jgi:hypothetical protein
MTILVVADREPDVAARGEAGRAGGRHVHGRRGHVDRPALRQGVARVDRDVEERELEVVRVHQHRGQVGRKARGDADARAERALQQVGHAQNERRYVSGLRAQVLAPREGEQTLGQRGAALRRLQRVRHQMRGLRMRGHAAREQVEVADDDGEEIVEVVRDPAGEMPDRLVLLRLAKRGLGALAIGDVRQAAQHARDRARAVALHPGVRQQVEDGSVLGNHLILTRVQRVARQQLGPVRLSEAARRSVCHEVRQRPAQHLGALVAEQRQPRVADLFEAASRVKRVERQRRAAVQGPEPFLAGAERQGLTLGEVREATIEHGGDEREEQDHEGRREDGQCQPGLANAGARIDRTAMQREARRAHAGEMHAGDRDAHHHSGGDAPGLAAVARGEPERGGRGTDRDQHRCGDPEAIVAEVGGHMHRSHAHVMHRDHAEAHDDAGDREASPRGSGAIHQCERQAGDHDCH